MKKLSAFLIFLSLFLCAAAQAQNSTQFNSGFISSTQCVSVPSSGLAAGSYSVTGGWTGTLTAYGSVGQGAQVSLGTATSNGSYTATVSGYTLFQVCGNSVVSGTAFVQVYATVSSVSSAGTASGLNIGPKPFPLSGGSAYIAAPADNTGALFTPNTLTISGWINTNTLPTFPANWPNAGTTGAGCLLCVVGAPYSGNAGAMIATFGSQASLTNLTPTAVMGAGFFTIDSIEVSGTFSGSGSGFVVKQPTVDPNMLGIWADTCCGEAVRMAPFNGTTVGPAIFFVHDYGNANQTCNGTTSCAYTYAITIDGDNFWSPATNTSAAVTTSTWDVSSGRKAPGILYVGAGGVGGTDGSIQSSRFLNGSLAPSAACTGLGTGTCALVTGADDSSGEILLSPTGAPAATGTATLTYSTGKGAYGTNGTTCFLNQVNGTGTWSAAPPPSFAVTTQSTTQMVITWTNSATALTAASTYGMNYYCQGR